MDLGYQRQQVCAGAELYAFRTAIVIISGVVHFFFLVAKLEM